MLKAVIFDFDGVIAESVDVKTEAFKELFNYRPDIVGDVEKFHLENGGMSRYDKFRYIYKELLKEPLSDERFNELCERFHVMVVDKVVESSFVPGAQEVLDLCQEKYTMYIVSGTPQEEMDEVVRRRKLGRYFYAVFGSPTSKTDLINDILKDKGYKPEEVLFIGDSRNDLKAAEDTGVPFIARVVGEDRSWVESNNVKRVFEDLRGLSEYIKNGEV